MNAKQLLDTLFQGSMRPTSIFASACWGVFIAFWTVSAFFVKRTKLQQPLLHRVFYVLLIVVAYVLLDGSIRIFHLNRPLLPHTIATGILGDFLVLAGLLIAIWARVTLGRNWSSRVSFKENHELIQHGPYRVVRHPIYAGLLLMITGTIVLVGQAIAFVALVVCFCSLWLRMRQEEALLTKHLPGYSEYMRRTKALVPYVL